MDDDFSCWKACLSADGWMCAVAGAGVRIRLAIANAPVWVWGAVISALPHKEERFLYPVYPLVGTLSQSCGAILCFSSNLFFVYLPLIWRHVHVFMRCLVQLLC